MEAPEVRQTLEADWPDLAAMLRDHDRDPVSGGLSYLEMSAITRFLAERLRAGDTERFYAFFQAVERCLVEGDVDAISLVTVGLMEDLQNRNITEIDSEVWLPFLGPTSREAWQAVEDFWSGDALAIQRFSLTLMANR